MPTTQQNLASTTWNQPRYYHMAKAASAIDHPAFAQITPITAGRAVLEVGCGEGSKLSHLPAAFKIGTDISAEGLKQARQNLPHLVQANSESLPFRSDSLDVAVSFFTLEHLTNPEAVIKEMLRIVKPNGYLIFLAPNFGSPLGASPCFKGSRLKKLLRGFVNDFLTRPETHLSWNFVEPLSATTKYDIDFDTTVEPYVRTLSAFLRIHGCTIELVSSQWQVPQENEKRVRKVFKWLGEHKIYPFTLWGPHLFVIARKHL